jgi:subtilisin family serine protease
MKVSVKHFLNVRIGKPSVNALSYQYLAPGSELDVDGKLYKGDKFEGIDTWLKDAANNYYWSGGVNFTGDIQDVLDHSTAPTQNKLTFPWFRRLNVENTWSAHNERGRHVTIAVLDTGHSNMNPDISTAVTQNRILIDRTHYPNIEFIPHDQSNDGHGTRCASIIGARNNREWIIGITPECQLLTGKISINREIRNFQYILDGIDWAIKQGAEIISISYAVELNPEEHELFNNKFQSIIKNKNVLIFAAAGNAGNTPLAGERYPASFDGCVSVGAITENNELSKLTIASDKTIIHAPGINIEAFGKGNTPDAQSGTSFSTPIVAAVAGLAVSYIKKRNANNWRSKDVLNLLYQTADAIPGHPAKKIINLNSLFNALHNQPA